MLMTIMQLLTFIITAVTDPKFRSVVDMSHCRPMFVIICRTLFVSLMLQNVVHV
jgi:hypothetical protein